MWNTLGDGSTKSWCNAKMPFACALSNCNVSSVSAAAAGAAGLIGAAGLRTTSAGKTAPRAADVAVGVAKSASLWASTSDTSEVPMLCSGVAEGAVEGAVTSVVAPGAGASINSKSEVPVLLRSGVAEGAAASVVSPEAGASVSGTHSGTYPGHACGALGGVGIVGGVRMECVGSTCDPRGLEV